MENTPVTVESLSFVIPAKNESAGLTSMLPQLRALYPSAEIIVVDDGSTDDTARIAAGAGARVISMPYSMGNGAAVKAGIRAVASEYVVLLDADGQHHPRDVENLLAGLGQGYEMMVGARRSRSQASVGRLVANTLYNRMASWMVGHPVLDLTSGFRAVKTEKFREFLHLLPNGFSYPTTITMSFFRAGYPVGYIPIDAETRQGKSHLNPLRDGVRFLLIIFRVGTLYSPMKMFVPFSFVFFLTGMGYYVYTYLTSGRFTNMSGLLLTTAVLVFLIGLVSEQITSLMFSQRERD